jgi:hypothetical protein
MDSIGTEQQMETTTAVRRVAIIGTPPGLGLSPTLIASSPHFHAPPVRRRGRRQSVLLRYEQAA